MQKTIVILGRQPSLGLAELESLYGAQAVRFLPPQFAIIETDQPVLVHRLGGAIKTATMLDTLPASDWHKVSRHIEKFLPTYIRDHVEPGNKVTLGISAHEFTISPAKINATALNLKKGIKKEGYSVRVVPNKEQTLNTAQVLHNKLATQNGFELILIRMGFKTIIARTTTVQDIEAYRMRDQERPARDARVGMLPPKLAQIIINLATNRNEGTILDPFCGTGVVLQESSLLGFKTYGTDLDARMVDYTRKNMEWLGGPAPLAVEQGDATTYQWQQFDTIACETYLGRPFSAEPDKETLTKVMHDVNIIHKKFFQNVARQTRSGFRMCVAVPAWHVKGTVKHLPVLDHLEEMGYNRISFVHAETRDLVYYRTGQVVGRELVVLTRK